MSLENIVRSFGKEFTMGELNTENLVMEAMRDLIKDEIKQHMKKKMEENPALKAEMKEAVEMFLEAKIRETFAGIKLAKAGTKMGLSVVPEKMIQDLSEEFSKVFEKELITIIERSL